MIVMKFGGTSIGTAAQIRRAADIIADRKDRDPLIVASAFSGVTNTLLRAAREALKGENLTRVIAARHIKVIRELELDGGLLSEELKQLNEILTGILWLQECTARVQDLLLSFGERISAKILAAHLTERGLSARSVASYDLGLITDTSYGAARPVPDVEKRIRRAYAALQGSALLVVTGFIGRSEDGDVTTLGRGGSDYTATIIGAALDAEEVQIWTDVSGVMTADPSVVPLARSLELLSYDEASELAYYGARVLHPATMTPARAKGIPIRVMNTMDPQHVGSLIVPTDQARDAAHAIKSIVYKEDQYLIHITAPRRLMMHGFMARLFGIFDRFGIVVDMISTSEVTVSLTLPSTTRHMKEAIRQIRESSDVAVMKDRTIMCCVGQQMRSRKGLAGRIFGCLGQAGVNVQMISQGAAEINVAFVINNDEIAAAVTALHREFFETEQEGRDRP